MFKNREEKVMKVEELTKALEGLDNFELKVAFWDETLKDCPFKLRFADVLLHTIKEHKTCILMLNKKEE